MPKSSSKSKVVSLPAGQKSLTSFFAAPKEDTASAVSPDKAATKKEVANEANANAKPKHRLKLTKVKQKVQENNGDFCDGRLLQFNADDNTYEVEIQNGGSEVWTCDQVDWGVLLHKTLGVNVAKWFGDDLYNGTVVDVTNGESIQQEEDGDAAEVLYAVVYEDGDGEDMNPAELEGGKALYAKQLQKSKKKRKAPKAAAPKSKRKAVVKLEEANAQEEEEDSDEDMDVFNNDKGDSNNGRGSRRRKSGPTSYKEEVDDDEEEEEFEFEDDKEIFQSKKKAASKKRVKLVDSDDSDFDGAAAGPDDDSDFDEDMILEQEDDDDDDDDELETEEDEKPKVKKGRALSKKAPTRTSTTATTATNRKRGKSRDDLQEKLDKDLGSTKPNNNPQKWLKAGTYVDPVGVDPTHGIVEGIVAAQVRKVGGLLLSATSHTAVNTAHPILGELTFPLRLQTACSGTDAPSIALGLIKESLDKMVSSSSNSKANDGDDDDDDDDGSNKKEHGFDYSHEMSCEIEPFKQAYIGRNFPGVPLFPDITKLTASEQVLDVYGRPQSIPEGNLFVAGTSCKDFSMLKTRDRLDIEDKGTSGETFLAAVEFLDQKQPPVAIFENVDGAPWAKMQEYIRGRIDLSERNNTKAIKDAKKKADADNELKFSVNKKGQYVAEEVPRQVGIRAGAVVEGVVRSGHDAHDVEPLTWDDHKGTGMVTLGALAKKHKIDLDADTLVLVKQARYCTHLCKLDTKNYGLPQTRNRKYLFIWRSDDPEDDLGEYFQEILNHLQTPLLHSMDAFFLPDSHDRIRCFREALRSGPGLLVKRERAKELDFFDWDLSHVRDVTCHLAYREKNGIDERARWLTGWDTRGRKELAPGLWPELFDVWNHRRLDMIDCFGAAGVRDAISRDPLHHSFTWDLSQNVTRAPFRSATVGVSGCVTPGGELLLPHKGRTVMGYEKLLLQGIPFSRLRLGPESEVQLSDLAGNAMSVSVICATMLSAICAPELRLQRKKDRKAQLDDFALSQKYDAAGGAILAERGDLFNTERGTDAKVFLDVFGKVAKELALDAFRSSVLCTCESSGTCTKDPKILECTCCGMGVCHDCSGRYRTSQHALKEIDSVSGEKSRPDPHAFERRLRCAVPSNLRLGQGWESKMQHGDGLEQYSFQLQQVDRNRGHWELTYGAWEDHGSARQVAECRVKIGRIGTLDPDVGVAASIRCFAPAIRHKKPVRGKLKDAARLTFKLSDSGEPAPCWEFPAASTTSSLQIVGSDPCDSHRIQVGLNDAAAKSLKAHKPMKAFIPPIQSRNNLTSYHSLWKTFPGTIVVSGDSSDQVNGKYCKLSCQQTIVHSALWRRDSGNDEPPMYIYIRPDVIRSGLDVAVISPTPAYADGMEVCELHDWIPENTLKESTHKTKATFLKWKADPDSLTVEVPNPTMFMTAQTVSFHEKICASTEQDAPNLSLCEMRGLSKEVIQVLLEYNEKKEAVIDLVGRSGTRNAKRLSIVAAPSLLKCAAEDKLPLVLSKWYRLSSSSEFGRCEINVPLRPSETWQVVEGRKFKIERVYDGEESNEYYQRLLNRPTAFQVSVEKSQGKLVVCMNPFVAAHRAAAQLGGEKAGPLDIDYCLSELSSMGEPDTKVFHVPNSDEYEETSVAGLELPLYKRQAKALTRMLAIESGDVPFSEEERSEHVLPGIGWCLIARAAKKSPLRGGVLGDAIGSGKTVVTIGLILAGAEKAHANRNVKEGRSSATLIVVPPGLVQQWDDERRKFTKGKLKCIVIDCTATLKKYSVEEICSADMVIVPAGIIEEGPTGTSRPYTEHLSKKAGAGEIPPAPTRYSQREAPTIEGTWIRNMASGPEIYVGNKGNQRTRDAQAYYGHCYSEAISKLREKTFISSERGVPIEYFTWERIVIDECHETLVTGKRHETTDADFKEKARRGAREFLGVAQTDITKRPLVAATGVWGLTGTPLLETEARVTELANLMGGTYLTGAAHHWRKEERESGRDLFLNQQGGTRSREYRCAVQEACHSYVKEACQRNRGEQLQVTLKREQVCVNMSAAEGEAFLKETAGVQLQSFAVSADQLGEKASDVLSITASSEARHAALLEKIDEIQQAEPQTKIIVFANSSYGGHKGALAALKASGKQFCEISDSHNVKEQNDIISWFRHVDATEEDRARPRILLLSFEQAAGHNLQEACHHVIIYDPMYSGTDAVADASVEEQAVGRVMRQGQKYDVTVTRIVVKGPKGERCLDDWIVERNLDENVLRAATSNFD